MPTTRRIAPITLAVIVLAACSSSESSTRSTTAASNSTVAPTATPVTSASTSVAPTTQPPTTTPATAAPSTAAPATTAPATTAPATTAPPTTEEPRAEAELIALAETALIDLTVFPEGWTETAPVVDDDDTEDDEFERQVDECLGVDDDADGESDLLESREARSGEFANPNDDTQPSVEQLVTVADDAAMAIRAMERAGVDGAAGCLQDTLQAFFDADPDVQLDESGIELGDLTVIRRNLDGDATEQVGYRVEIPLTLEGQTFVQYLDVLYQRQGRALSQLQLASFSVPFPDEGYASLSRDVVLRLEPIGG